MHVREHLTGTAWVQICDEHQLTDFKCEKCRTGSYLKIDDANGK